MRLVTLDVKVNLFTDHHFGKLSLGCFVGINRTDIFSLSKNGNSVGKRKNLVQFMGDNYNTLTVVSHTAKYTEKFFCFLRGKHCGRLVQNKNIGTSV